MSGSVRERPVSSPLRQDGFRPVVHRPKGEWLYGSRAGPWVRAAAGKGSLCCRSPGGVDVMVIPPARGNSA